MCGWYLGQWKRDFLFINGIKHRRSLSLCQLRPEIGTCFRTKFLDNGNMCWKPTWISPIQDNGLGFIKLGRRTLSLSNNVWSVLLPLACAYTISFCPSQFNASQLAPSLDASMNGKTPMGIWLVYFTRLKLFTLPKGKKKTKREGIIFFYSKMATLSEDYDRWHWIEGYRFLNYTMKFGRDSNINMTLGTTCAMDKWQG